MTILGSLLPYASNIKTLKLIKPYYSVLLSLL